MNEAIYRIANGSKLEVSATDGGTYTQIKGTLAIPEIGGKPNEIDSTTLDNLEFESNVYGLKPAVALEIEMNMEDPSAQSNIKTVFDMAEAKTVKYFKITYSNGITVSFASKVFYSFSEAPNGDLLKFKMYLSAIGEPTTTIPSSTSL